MKDVLKVEFREKTGKSKLKILRNNSFIPAVVYGSNKENKNIKVSKVEIEKFLHYHGVGTSLVLKLGEEKISAIMKDFQRAPLKGNLIHIDFQELSKGEKIKVRIPIHFINKESVEDAINIVTEQLHDIEIHAMPKDLVDFIEVDLSTLKEAPIKVGDLEIFKNEDVELALDEDLVVASLTTAGKEVEEEVSEDEETIEVL
ncbi:50S ribosomal protein L25 [Helicovermis profundi]|uniref:Large ribosomal subunit protein bL25 n=1 Tax=Helicovermis profundi TaxID=3065157 RepID=A0AAU9EE84_9FIRM|nr:50S ribosomal protein L25/general stress protein Ctc [Clostridia bacterium S502]